MCQTVMQIQVRTAVLECILLDINVIYFMVLVLK